MDAETVARSYFDKLTNAHDVSYVDTLFTDDIAFHDPAWVPTGLATGHDEVKKFFGVFFKAFPDVHFTVDDLLWQDDKAAVRFTWTGTHRASFLGLHLTDRHVSVPGIDIFHLRGDQIAEVRVAFDRFELVEQLGGIHHPL